MEFIKDLGFMMYAVETTVYYFFSGFAGCSSRIAVQPFSPPRYLHGGMVTLSNRNLTKLFYLLYYHAGIEYYYVGQKISKIKWD
jgi:hypothetical protein